MTTLLLYTRPGCHLCDEARVLLERAGRGLSLTVQPVNIDDDPALAERYGARVPVVSIDGKDVLEWPFTEAQARRALTGPT